MIAMEDREQGKRGDLAACRFCERQGFARVEEVDRMVGVNKATGEEVSSVPVYSVVCGYCGAQGPMELDERGAASAWNGGAKAVAVE